MTGVHPLPGVLGAEGQPPLLRPGGKPGQYTGAQLQHMGALQPPPDGQHLLQPLRPSRHLQQGQRRLPAGGKGQLPRQQRVGDLPVDLSDQLLMHRLRLSSPPRPACPRSGPPPGYFFIVSRGARPVKNLSPGRLPFFPAFARSLPCFRFSLQILARRGTMGAYGKGLKMPKGGDTCESPAHQR